MNILKTDYQGVIFYKKRYIGVLGEGIVLYIDCGISVRTIDTASWVLEKFNIGNRVKWVEGFFIQTADTLEII